MPPLTTDTVIIDDGDYYISLKCNMPQGEAPGFLHRRGGPVPALHGVDECIGSFDFEWTKDGRQWGASVSAPLDEATDTDARHLGHFSGRVDAIAALWQARHSAHCRPR